MALYLWAYSGELVITSQHQLHEKPASEDFVFIFEAGNLLLFAQALPRWRDVAAYFVQTPPAYCFARDGDQACLLLDAVPELLALAAVEMVPVKQSQQRLALADFQLAGLAFHIHHWRANNRYCGRCGQSTIDKSDERALQCTACQHVIYPRLSPSIIVLIQRGEQVLLARSPHFMAGMFSTLAGFVEPGESAEEALQREVYEEVGLQVTNIRYFASQPWPFPDSLMLGYFADHASGEIAIDEHEIEAAAWFSRDDLPPLPSTVSIARRLIDTWLNAEI